MVGPHCEELCVLQSFSVVSLASLKGNFTQLGVAGVKKQSYRVPAFRFSD